MSKQRTPRAPRPSVRPQSRSLLAAVGYLALALSCVILGAVTFLLVASPVDGVRDRVIQQLQLRTGREVSVAGSTSLALFPRPAVTISNLAFSAPAGMGGEPTVAVQALEAEVGLSSLMLGTPRITRVILTRPTIELRVDTRGQRSWELERDPAATPPASAASTTRSDGAAPPSRPRAVAALEKHSLESVRVIGGALRYIDERRGARTEVAGFDADLRIDGATGPVRLGGQLTLNGEAVAFEGTLSSLHTVLEGSRARLTARLNGRSADASFDGSVSGESGIEGNVTMRAGSAGAIAAWLGRPLAGGRDPGALSLSSGLRVGNGQIALSSLEASVGPTALTGALTIDTGRSRPYLTGDLQFAELDLGRLLLRPAASAAPPTPRSAPPAPRAPPSRPGDSAPTANPRDDWADDAIDLTWLGQVDADLSISAQRVVFKELLAGPGRLTVAVKDQVGRVSLDELSLYGGRGRGVVTLDGSGELPVVGIDLGVEGASVLPLLKGALGFEWLEGRGDIKVALAGQGRTERDIITALNGTLSVAMGSGAITGIDFNKILRNVQQARFGDLSPAPGDKTAFSELAGQFTVTNGIAANQDMRLVSSAVRVTGAGSANLPLRQVDYVVRPKIVSLPGSAEQGTPINLAGLEVPIQIKGPWRKPGFTVQGQERLVDTVKQIGRNLKSQEVQEAIRGLLNGEEGQRVKPRELLEKLLKKP